MRSLIQPLLQPVSIADLRPTQMTVGMAEVDRKRALWRKREATQGAEFLGRSMVPVVIGPKGQPWLIDQHHLVLALHLEGLSHVLVSEIARLDTLGRHEFLTVMDKRNWLHPYDASGKRRDISDLPKKISKLDDDIYRSLAGQVREAGGYAKDNTPFAEFLWADFFRTRIKHGKQTGDALAKALMLAHAKEAQHLPGWCGED
jgi:hypothetical protein